MIQTLEQASCICDTAIASHFAQWKSFTAHEKYITYCEPPFNEEDLKDEADWTNNYNFERANSQMKQRSPRMPLNRASCPPARYFILQIQQKQAR